MPLVDTSVWVEHLRRGHPPLAARLERNEVWGHPFVLGEIACGHLRDRREVLRLLTALPQSQVADHAEVLAFVERNDLVGRGLGWIEVHLLASARLSRQSLWTFDRRLERVARELGTSET